ncbi:MAG TPA: cytochrome c3 family protein [Candidatus Methanoperedens sp.]|nr:cytochrome c3 family protein [Candidatus Methanoperedens sp.]
MHRIAGILALSALVLVSPGRSPAAIQNFHNTTPCTACHGETPRFGIDTRKTVTFKTSADDPALCLSCHAAEEALHPILVPAGSGPAGGQRSTYLPAGSSLAFDGKIVCTSCHFIHAADGRYNLLRGFPGSPDPRYFTSWQEFCSECHGTNLRGRSPHRAGEKSCAYCHPAKPKPGDKQEVTSRGRDLCLLCHGTITREHYEQADPFGDRSECTGCHDPHVKPGDNPSLLNAAFFDAAKPSRSIRPHFRKAFCFACHENLDDYALLTEDVNGLCNRCHASGEIAGNIHPLKKVPQGITVPKGWPLADGALTCLTCHEQGHEDQERVPKLLRGGPYDKPRDPCWRCHDRDNFNVSDIHKDINEGRRCEFCHAVRPERGKDTIMTVGFVSDPNLPCVTCHEETHEHLASHYGSPRQPPGGSVPPEMPLYQGQRMMCATCHNPHDSEVSSHKLRGSLSTDAFCMQCHRF